MKKVLLAMMFGVLAGGLEAQDLVPFANTKGRFGYADGQGNEVIPCVYDKADPFVEGVAVVSKGGKHGIIDAQGKAVLPLQYNRLEPWGENLYLVVKGKKMGLADRQGKLLLQPIYVHISQPNAYGKAVLVLKGSLFTTLDRFEPAIVTLLKKKPSGVSMLWMSKGGLVDSKGTILVEPVQPLLRELQATEKRTLLSLPFFPNGNRPSIYLFADQPLEGNCEYMVSGGVKSASFPGDHTIVLGPALLDARGKTLIPMGTYDQVMPPRNGMLPWYHKLSKKKTTYGYHDLRTGKSFQVGEVDQAVTQIKGFTHGQFMDSIAPVWGNGRICFVDRQGNIVRKEYDDFKLQESASLWAARQAATGQWDVFDFQNQDLPGLSGAKDIQFPASAQEREVYNVKRDGKWGSLTRDGQTILPFKYDDAQRLAHGVIAMQHEGKWGLFSEEGKMLVPTQYKALHEGRFRGQKRYWVSQNDALWYLYDVEKQTLGKQGYRQVMPADDKLAAVLMPGQQVADTWANRCQVFDRQASSEEIKAVDLTAQRDSFYTIVDAQGRSLLIQPVHYHQLSQALAKVKALGSRPLTAGEAKDLLLSLTERNRSYGFSATIEESEWNY